MREWGSQEWGGGAAGGGAVRAGSWVTSKVQRVHRSIDYVLCYGPGLSWDRRPSPKNNLDKNNRLGFTVRTHGLCQSGMLLSPADKRAGGSFLTASFCAFGLRLFFPLALFFFSFWVKCRLHRCWCWCWCWSGVPHFVLYHSFCDPGFWSILIYVVGLYVFTL